MGHFKEKFQVQGTQKEAVPGEEKQGPLYRPAQLSGSQQSWRGAWSHVEVNSEGHEIPVLGELYLSDSGVWAFELKRGRESLSFITGLTGCHLIILLQKVARCPLDAFAF